MTVRFVASTPNWMLRGQLLVLLGLVITGCGTDVDWFADEAPSNAAVKPNLALGAPVAASSVAQTLSRPTANTPDFARIPVPPEGGPLLAPIAMKVRVLERPERSANVIGSLRIGARVSRSKEPVGKEGCRGGYYAIRPIGFVCADEDVTTNLEHPLARAIQVEPNLSWPMPYRYGFVRAIAPNYLRVPSKDEQFKYEMRLDRHLRSWKKLGAAWDDLDVGANDVPLDASGLALGSIPEHARPLGISERFGGNGDDRLPWWLAGGRKIPNISAFRAPTYAVMANRVKRHAGVAMIGSFLASEQSMGRRFVVTTDARLIPADKIKANSGSPFHGQSIADVGLPVAFAFAKSAASYEYVNDDFRRKAVLPFRQMLPLNGMVKLLDGTRWVQTRAGDWVRSDDVRTAVKLSQLPVNAKGKTHWIDVSLLQQTLVLYEGETPVYATLISSGRDGLGDPTTTLSTPQGLFRVYQKHVTTTMDSDAADSEFELRDVPWVMYFKSGYAIHAAYWHDDFGRARSHGCINLSPIDARYVFRWTSPEVPLHWHSVSATDALEPGTLVNVHP